MFLRDENAGGDHGPASAEQTFCMIIDLVFQTGGLFGKEVMTQMTDTKAAMRLTEMVSGAG
jgi:hypothetical protein